MSQWASEYIEKLKKGESVSFRPSGRSMEPLIRSGQLCLIQPVSPQGAFMTGDIVLCEVNGDHYLHRVGARSYTGKWWYRIENAAGRINDWITIEKIYGWLYSVD